MTQEEKLLLLKELYEKLLYKVKGIITYNKSNTTFIVEGIDNNVLHLSDAEECYVEDFKPYLRPMSSMTRDESYELDHIEERYDNHYDSMVAQIDWLNSRYFDYRGLIEKGLALEAPEGMYTNS